MHIFYPSEHNWIEPILEDPVSGLGKKNQARVRSSLRKLPDTTVSSTVEPLTQSILDWFTPLYTEQIGQKSNPKIHDLYANTIGKDVPYTYHALIVKENGRPVGATIFSKRTHILSIAYRIYPRDWKQNTLQASPSLFAEYLINRYAFECGYKKLSHGKDRNPYGINANIGLALFKLSVGCLAYLPTAGYEVRGLDLTTVSEDILVFEMPAEGIKRITKGYLCVSKESLQKYDTVTKYPKQILIEVILRD